MSFYTEIFLVKCAFFSTIIGCNVGGLVVDVPHYTQRSVIIQDGIIDEHGRVTNGSGVKDVAGRNW